AGSELRTLVAVEDLGQPEALQRLAQRLEAEARIHAVRQPPGQQAASADIDDADLVAEAPGHGGVGVGPDWDAEPGLLPVGFPRPPSEPDVRVSAHPALRNLKPLVRSLSALGSPMVWG